jgi:hypothetical protein
MKNILLKTLTALAVTFAVSATAFADPIDGSVAFAGTPKFNNANINLATQVSFLNTPHPIALGDTSGDFNMISNDYTISLSSLTFGPTTVIPSTALWTIKDLAVGGDTYTFWASTFTATSPQNNVWNFSGAGDFDISGPTGSFSSTAGTWIITLSKSGSSFGFESTNTTIPDGGTTALLVGVGLLGLGLYARRSRLAKI